MDNKVDKVDFADIIEKIEKLNKLGIIESDVAHYIIESIARANLGLHGCRAYRDENGVLGVNFPD